MLVGAAQIHLLSLLLLVVHALALPSGSSSQVALVNAVKKEREYENGERPPEENTLGWTDPRLNGGRFLDVRTLFFLICRIYAAQSLIPSFWYPDWLVDLSTPLRNSENP